MCADGKAAYPSCFWVIIAVLSGIAVLLVLPYIYNAVITSTMPQIIIPNKQYPDTCLNIGYVKGNGSQKSDYYFDTDNETCNSWCHPLKGCVGACNITAVSWCGCCKARGYHV